MSVHLVAKHRKNPVPASAETFQMYSYLFTIDVVAGPFGRVGPLVADGLLYKRD